MGGKPPIPPQEGFKRFGGFADGANVAPDDMHPWGWRGITGQFVKRLREAISQDEPVIEQIHGPVNFVHWVTPRETVLSACRAA